MATQDEIFRIRYQAEGEGAIKRAQAELDKLQSNADKAAESFRRGVRNEEEFAKAAELIGQKIAKARTELAAYQALAAKATPAPAPARVNRTVADTPMRPGDVPMWLRPGAFDELETKAPRSARNLGMAALEAGRALEDLNYGLMGVMNNVPQLAMALGAGAGLTGVISTLGAATLFLYRNWDTVANALKLGIPNDTLTSLQRARTELDEINSRLDAIASKPRISLAEKIETGTLRIKREDLERQLGEAESLDALFGKPSDREQEVGKAVADVIRNSGVDRADFGALLMRGIEAGGGAAAFGLGNISPLDAARRLSANAEQGDEFSALQLARALEAGGGRGAELARSLRVGLSGNPSAADFGPTRETLEQGLAEMARPVPEQAGDAMVESYREMNARIAEDARRAMQVSGADFGPTRETMEEGLRRQEEDAIFMRLASMPPGMLSPRAPGVFGAESFAQAVQAGGAQRPEERLRMLHDETQKQTREIAELRRVVERFGHLGA